MTFALTGAGVSRLLANDDRIVITGAGGWLGLATLDLLHRLLGEAGFAARVRCYGSRARTLALRDGTAANQEPLASLSALDKRPTIVLHHAFLTKDRAQTMSEADYVAANLSIRDTVLGCLDIIGTRALFVPSSGAARSADDANASDAMRLYGRLKQSDEIAFATWAADRGCTAAIVRVFNIAGPYINKHGAYALASFILNAQAGKPIAVTAPRPVMRNYAAIEQLMSVVFGHITLPGGDVEAFDSGGAGAVEMLDVAHAVARVVCAGSRSRSAPVAVTRAPIDPALPIDNYVGDPHRYDALCDQHGVAHVDFDSQIALTAAYLAKMTT